MLVVGSTHRQSDPCAIGQIRARERKRADQGRPGGEHRSREEGGTSVRGGAREGR